MANFTNDIFEKEDKHYVTLFVISEYDSGEVKNIGPDKCDKGGWFSWDDLPQPLFTPIKNLLNKKFNPFE